MRSFSPPSSHTGTAESVSSVTAPPEDLSTLWEPSPAIFWADDLDAVGFDDVPSNGAT